MSNYGSYEGVPLWLNCAADIVGAPENSEAKFFLANSKEEPFDDNNILIRGNTVNVLDVVDTTYISEMRSEKLETGLFIDKIPAGHYFVGCCVSVDGIDYYGFTPFNIYEDYYEYAKAGLDIIIDSYANGWFGKTKHIGLGGNTNSDTGIDWEAWIFTALGDSYQHASGLIDFNVDGAFLSSDEGITYLDYLETRLLRHGEDEVRASGTKDLFRYIAAVCACGKDPRNFAGMNLVEMMLSYAYDPDGAPAINTKTGALRYPKGKSYPDILSISYELLGLEIADAKPLEGYTKEIRRAGIIALLKMYGTDVITDGTLTAPDYYVMAMLPMAFLRDDIKYQEEIDTALDNMKRVLSNSYMFGNGALRFAASTENSSEIFGAPNADTAAVAVNSIVINKLGDMTDPDYVKKYGSLLTALCGDIVEGGVLYGSEPNRMATYQTLGALVDLYNGKSCFEIAHEKYQQNYPECFTDDYGKLSITSVSAIDEQRYTGESITPEVSVIGKKYGRSVDSEGELVRDVDYTVEYKDNIEPGQASVVITGIGDYYGKIETSFNIIKEEEEPVVVKKKQPMTVKPVLKKVSFKKLKKKAQVVKGALIVKNNRGKVSYKKISGSKKLTINKKTGRITVKKKTKKGTYKIRVKVTAAGNSLYKAGSRTVTVKIRVK